MTELWLKFKDENGKDRRVLVGEEKFTVGRHSENHLSVPIGKLSRQHLKIDRFADVFIASDAGSSNGTTLNGKELAEPTPIKNGDVLDLGGGLKIEVEIASDDPNAAPPPPAVDPAAVGAPGASVPSSIAAPPVPAGAPSGAAAGSATGVDVPSPAPAAGPAGVGVSSAAAAGSPTGTLAAPTAGKVSAARDEGSMFKTVLLLAPLLVIVLLVFVGGMIYILSGNRNSDTGNNKDDDFVYSTDRDDDDDTNDNKSESNDIVTTKTPSNSSNGDVTATPDGSNSEPTPIDLTGTAKVERNAAVFLRKIAQNQSRAFLTGEQAKAVDDKIKQVKSSTALADNIKSANRSAAQIRALAAVKNLKPQFLATAAIAKLGSSRGDVLQTAQSMAGVLDKLSTQIGNELADDALLLIAAYDQGEAGEFMKMRNMLQDLANKSTESSRTVRTIWFLQKNNKITASEFEFALRFLAIGTLMQNPKDFGVNTEALVL